jgi:WD40 repeat protein
LLVASSFNRAIWARDAGTGEVVGAVTIPDKQVWQGLTALSADGKRLAWWGGFRASGHVHETGRGQPISQFGGLQALHGLVLSSDGKLAAGIAGLSYQPPVARPIILWDATTGRELHRLVGHDNRAVTALALSPGNRLLASAAEDGTVRLWDTTTGKEVLCRKNGQDRVSCLLFSGDGKQLLSGGDDGTVLVWDVTRRAR